MYHNKNAIATPLTEFAYKLHTYIFNGVYPCPLHLSFKNGRASMKLESVFQLKYIPFLLNFVLFTSIIIPGSCIFLLAFKLFKPNESSAGSLSLVCCIMLGSFSIYQVIICLLYYFSSGIDAVMNQMFLMERKCKCFTFIQVLTCFFY